MRGDIALELDGIWKSFAGRDVLKGVSVAVPEGGSFALVGESGSGKTTLARIALGLIEADKGRIIYKGRDISLLGGNEKRSALFDMQMIFQDPLSALNPKMTVFRTVAEPLEIRGGDREAVRAGVVELLSDVGLDASYSARYPSELSGGEAQRVCIARSLAARPKILILDEPLSSLDLELQEGIIRLITQLRREKALTYIFITHDLMLAQRLCSAAAVMKEGVIVECGPADEVFKAPRHEYTRQLLSDAI